MTAVDNSAEMLAHVPEAAEKVLGDIQTLTLGRQLDAVLMSSNLINLPDAHMRSAMLQVCRAHLSAQGQLFFERHDPGWLHTIKTGKAGKAGDVQLHIDAFEKRGSELFVKLAYHRAGSVWMQEFSTRILDDDEVLTLVKANGFSAPKWLSESRCWGRCGCV
ncbi:MAG: class I SAM-dependent methyltransferase [Burkholderiaceae bacterium]